MSIRRDKFPEFDPETGLVTDYVEVEHQAEPGKPVAYFPPQTEEEEEDRPTLGPDEHKICTHLETALPDPRQVGW